MTGPIVAPGIPHGTRHECPLRDCTWYHDEPGLLSPGYTPPRDPAAESARIDQVIGAHLRTHGLIEWLLEVMSLRGELAKYRDPTDWGQPGTQWACGVRRPDGSAILDEDAAGMVDDETAVRAYVDLMQDSNGYRKALLRRDVSAWREVEPAAVARDEAPRTHTSESIDQ